MTYLKINRLIVVKNNEYVYDEIFHNGVNIIRGDNGSGKSTISNFIYYILGGDFGAWLPEAKLCDFVIAEVKINDFKTITLKRAIDSNSMTSMDIFFGTFENSLKSSLSGWSRYGYRRSESKESFSQVLFKLLDFPEISTDNGDNVTINQVLRLLYIDQLTPINSLVKTIDFDSPLIRDAVSHLLLGAYSDKLLTNQQKLKVNTKKLNDYKKEHTVYSNILKASGTKLTIEGIDKLTNNLQEQLDKINKSLDDNEKLKKTTNSDVVNKNILEKKDSLNKLRNQAIKENENINKLRVNILDSEDFIDDLNKQYNALSTSLTSRTILGELPLAYCPSCLGELDTNEHTDKCGLCKQDIQVDKSLRVLNMQQELSNQIKESTQLLLMKKKSLNDSEIKLNSYTSNLKLQQKEFDNYTNSIYSTYDKKLEELLIKKGRILSEIENKIKEKESIIKLDNIQKEIDKLSLENSRLEREIVIEKAELKQKVSKALQKIQEYTLLLLKEDGRNASKLLSNENSSNNKDFYEEAFINAKQIHIDFTYNSFTLDDRSNFSASSLVILKNAIRFGIFFASVELDYFRYPRFILCDNIEDKGMNEKRSKNFQQSIVTLANKFKEKEFQIIFTTSMMNEDLDNTSYTIGTFYDSNNKSLKI